MGRGDAREHHAGLRSEALEDTPRAAFVPSRPADRLHRLGEVRRLRDEGEPALRHRLAASTAIRTVDGTGRRPSTPSRRRLRPWPTAAASRGRTTATGTATSSSLARGRRPGARDGSTATARWQPLAPGARDLPGGRSSRWEDERDGPAQVFFRRCRSLHRESHVNDDRPRSRSGRAGDRACPRRHRASDRAQRVLRRGEYSLVRARRSASRPCGTRAARRRWRSTQLDDIGDYISAAQVGVTMTSIGIGALGEPVLAGLFEDVFGDAPRTASRSDLGAVRLPDHHERAHRLRRDRAEALLDPPCRGRRAAGRAAVRALPRACSPVRRGC